MVKSFSFPAGIDKEWKILSPFSPSSAARSITKAIHFLSQSHF